MNFNLDLVCAELADLRPVKRFRSSPQLDLDRIEMLRPANEPRAGSLLIAEADELAASGSAIARSGPFVVLGCESEEALGPAAGSPAILLPPSDQLPKAPELLTRLLEYRMRLDSWSEGILAAMARDAPLQEIFEAAATMFANPLMLSDSSLYFVLTAGRLPDGFRDRLWTPAIETGMCPSELYFKSWTKSSGDAFGRPDAYLVPNAAGDGRTYLVRNLVRDGAYHGCFELVDANAPLTPADLALADRFGDMLGMVLPRKAYPQIAEASLGPLRDLLTGSSVRPRVLEYGLANMGWKTDDAYYVAHFGGVDEEADARRAQTARRIAEHYPLARFYDDGTEHVMIAREADYPLGLLHGRHERHDVDPGAEQRFRVGFSSLFTDFSLLRTAADQAAFAHRRVDESPSASAFGVSRTCFYDDCWFEDAVERLSLEDGVHRLLDRGVVDLALRDARDGTDHVATALAYLEHGCSAGRTAEALYVHRNTLAYRLKRIKAISGIDLENLGKGAADPLRVHLSCRLLSNARASSALAES